MKMKIHDSTIECIQGDITRQEVDVVVNAANEGLIGGGGVDGAIRRAAGPSVDMALEKLRNELGGCPTGTAVLTGAGNIKAKFIIHAVGPVWEGGRKGEPDLLAGSYRESLKLAEAQGARSIAFPAISTGAYGYPMELASRVAGEAIIAYLRKGSKLELVRLVAYDSAAKNIWSRILVALLPTKRY